MITSQRLARSVLRVKPVACGNHVYLTGTLSSSAMMFAILFSKPSSFSFENGMFAGSAQTRSTWRLTRSERWPSTGNAALVRAVRKPRPQIAAPASFVSLAVLATKAIFLFLLSLFRFVGAVATTELARRQRAGRTSLEVYVEVVDEAHHVLVVAERGHHKFGTGFVALLARRHDPEEVAVRDPLQVLGERRSVGRAEAVGAMANVALAMVAAIAVVGRPIDDDRAVLLADV